MRTLNIVPKTLEGDPLRFSKSILLQNVNKIEGGGGLRRHFSEKSLKKAEKGRKCQCQKMERGFWFWNDSVIHVRDFGCVQNQVLNTYGKSKHYQCASAQKVDHSE